MMSEMQADVTAAIRALQVAMGAVVEAIRWVEQVNKDLGRPSTLPAPALTEQAIVDALKADPAMAGRVIVELCYRNTGYDREAIGRAAYNRVTILYGGGPSHSLQSLAVALAAASYRG